MKKKRWTGKKAKWADHYTRRAKAERFPARSVYKLKEIHKKHRIIKTGDTVLDLGCAPGSWLLYAAQLVGKTGRVVGVDLKPVTARMPENVETHVGDVLGNPEHWKRVVGGSVDVVLSDMAPSTTGHKGVDAARSEALCESALYVARSVLDPGGVFVCKIFQGGDFKKYVDGVREAFQRVQIFKPQSSRSRSKEIYIIGFDKIGG